ncbi:MAG: hypothetical protein L0Y57_15105, partial [Beijerinckiaceae bacterium]|nr:hypothetical protein [Beijerinckiaceae bacterium]
TYSKFYPWRGVAGSVVLGTLAQPALAANIDKCQTIAQPGTYKLVRNLTAAAGNCLVVTGSAITIDLDGFTITGNANGDAITDGPGATGSQRAITVRNGHIIGARFAVALGKTDGAVVENMDISGNGGGIFLLRGRVERNHVHGNTSSSAIEGFEAITAINNIVLDNKGNGLVAGPGSLLEGNLAGRNGNGIVNTGNAFGTVLVGNAILRDNVAFWNTNVDIAVTCPGILTRNVVAGPAPKISKKGTCTGSPNEPAF